MVIEPLTGSTTIQAQTAVKPVEAQTTAANTEVSAAVQSTNTDSASSAAKTENNGETSVSAELNTEEQRQVANEKIKKAVEQLNKNMPNSEAVFGIHDGTNRVTIKIVDKDTKEIIREYPPEKTLDMIEKVWEMAGILVDEKR